MKISIITATYNSELTIRDTLESVLAQTYLDIEYIIKDGASKDNTLDVVREYEPKFKGKMKIISSPDMGIYDAMNIGIHATTGDVVGLINSDDILFDKNVIADIASAFDDKTDAIYGNGYCIDPHNPHKVLWKEKSGNQKSFSTGWFPAHPSFYIRKNIYEKYGYFDTSYRIAADVDFMCRVIEKYKIRVKYLQRNIYLYRVGGTSNGSIKALITNNKECLRLLKENGVIQPSLIIYIIRKYLKRFVKIFYYKMMAIVSPSSMRV